MLGLSSYLKAWRLILSLEETRATTEVVAAEVTDIVEDITVEEVTEVVAMVTVVNTEIVNVEKIVTMVEEEATVVVEDLML